MEGYSPTPEPSGRLGTRFLAGSARRGPRNSTGTNGAAAETGRAADVLTPQVAMADRMMTHAVAKQGGVMVTFADDRTGLVPLSSIPEIRAAGGMVGIELPNPHVLLLHLRNAEPVELPWDFVRRYCDAEYRPGMERLGKLGKSALGRRIKALREAAGKTREELATSASIGRVTVVRIERGE